MVEEPDPPRDDAETSPDEMPTEVQTGSASSASEPTGRQIGPYRLLERIGVGGMGEVWLAQQEEPVRRRVALKLIKLGMDTEEVVARFEAERQALALMSHPNIAKVLDAGSTPEGRPYFTMEYVPGIKITAYCDKHRLDAPQRLELFMQVCRAVQHAHQKSIIHRDIKPSNILVSLQEGVPVPKVIDFGIAKATSMRLTEKSVYTRLGMMIGTPVYMSPEQAEMTGLDVDTTTDIYSLGVLLYELLIGVLPFSTEMLRAAGWEEMGRILREYDPPTPSSRLMALDQTAEDVATRRRTDVGTLQRRLRGDLDWIVMKAMEKDRTRRYESASGLAEDIGRHLADEPVNARPPSTGYRIRKFARRHRVGVIAAAVATIALLIGTGGTTVGMMRARRAEAQATRAETLTAREAETARQTLDFMIGLFQESYPSRARGETITVREILDRGADRIERELGDQPRVQARLMGSIGDVYLSLGLYDEAEALVGEALEIETRELGVEHEETYDDLIRLGRLYQAQSRFAEAVDVAERSLAIAEAAYGPEDPRSALPLNQLAEGHRGRGNFEPALAYARRALAIQENALGRNHISTIETVRGLGWLLRQMGELDEARSSLERALPIMERYHGPEAPAVADVLNDLAVVLQDLGAYADARLLLERSLTIKQQVLPPDHPVLAWAHNNLGNTHWYMGEFDEAKRYYQAAMEINERALGPFSLPVARNLNNLATTARQQSELGLAETLSRRALDIKSRVLGEGHPEVGTTLTILGSVVATYDPQLADDLYERGLAILERALGPDHLNLAQPVSERAVLVSRVIGDYAAAESALERSLTIRESILPPGNPVIAGNLAALAEIYHYRGRHPESVQLYERAISIWEQAPEPDNLLITAAMLGLAGAHASRGAGSEAESLYERTVAGFDPTEGASDALVAYEQASYLALTGQRGRALDLLRRALEQGETADGPSVTLSLLAQFIAVDPDLVSLHGDPEFETIVADITRMTSRD